MAESAKAIYNDSVRPALNRLHKFLRDEYVPSCRESVGRSALPNGRAWYDYQIKHYTTTTLGADEIHNIGLREVKRIRDEMEAILASPEGQAAVADVPNFATGGVKFMYDEEEVLIPITLDG